MNTITGLTKLEVIVLKKKSLPRHNPPIIKVIVFAINTTANIIKGCIKATDATLPSCRH